MATKNNTLSPQHREFLRHYLRIWNATEAAKLAGYKGTTAHVQGPRLLKRPDIAAELDRLQQLEDVALDVQYNEYIEICSKGLRAGGRDATAWAQRLEKARGWDTMAERAQHKDLPAPHFCDPDKLPDPDAMAS